MSLIETIDYEKGYIYVFGSTSEQGQRSNLTLVGHSLGCGVIVRYLAKSLRGERGPGKSNEKWSGRVAWRVKLP